MNWILSFCGGCGILLPSGLGNEEDSSCTNCNHNVKEKSDRIEGVFAEEDAQRLLQVLEG